MKKNNNNQKGGNCGHIQLGGQAFYNEQNNYFLFAPDDPVAERMIRFRGPGIGQRMTDGTFDFVSRPRVRSQSELIKKLAHGRVSMTKDGAIQLTLKVFADEGINIGSTMLEEADAACRAIVDHLLPAQKGGIMARPKGRNFKF